jgi:hypothetical protein
MAAVFTGVNIAHLVVNEHGPIFADLIELLTSSLQELGLSVRYSPNCLNQARLNVLIGHTVCFPPAGLATLQNSGCTYVVFQAEALNSAQGLIPLFPAYLDFVRAAAHVWDYSEANIRFLAGLGHTGVRHVPVGCAGRLERIVPAAVKDIDILFYGQPSDRRLRILEEMQGHGLRVQALWGVYGPARDQLIGRSKIVLNLHQFETSQLEQVRIAYLLNNHCFVVSEAADCNPYGEGVVFCPREHLADRCAAFLRPGMEAERERIARAGYARLKAIPMTESLRAALEGFAFAPAEPCRREP